MPTLKPITHLRRPISPLKYVVSSCRPPPLTAAISTTTTTTTTTNMSPITTIEHFVLFKVRPSTDPSKSDAMISNLRSLLSLDIATHLTAGPLLRLRSPAASDLGFTHLLHSRYRSKSDLAAYSTHPSHVAVVKENVLPICDLVMAVDWVANIDGPAVPPPGSALRLNLAKPKEGLTVAELVATVAGVVGTAPSSVVQASYGENFSPARARGYDVGFLSVFPAVKEMEELDEEGEGVKEQKEKVRPLVESVIVVDYVVPAASNASL